MESFHPTPVVPSNAPLWSDVDQDSRILREQCANRQLGYIQTHHNPDWSTGINDDTACGSAVARMPSYLPQFHRTNSSDLNWLGLSNNKYDRKAYRLFNNLNRQRHPGTEKTELGNQAKDREAEYNARVLAARFARCDGYIKYRNRQPKEKKGNKEDQKWPDHIEDAFIVALCRHPPCGRKQSKAPGEEDNEDAKPLGRNELIADYILRNTGEKRTRKQVSSHIQVLKPFVQNEKIIMRFLATPTNKESAASRAARKKASEYNPGAQLRTGSLSQYRTRSLQSGLDLQPEEFCMFMRQELGDTSKVLHTYSTTDQYSPGKRCVQSQAELYGCFPGLANVPLDRFRTGRFLALHVPILLHPQDLAGKTELAISWVFRSIARHTTTTTTTVSSRTQLYLHGRPIFYDRAGSLQFLDNPDVELSQNMRDAWILATKEYEATEVRDHSDLADPSSHHSSKFKSDEGKTLRYYVPFSSTFWARYLWHVAMLQRSVTSLETRPLQPNESAEERRIVAQKKRLEVSNSLGELTAVQEIVAATDRSEPQVVLTVHFTFSHATDSGSATTTWENLDLSNAFGDVAPLSAGGVSQVSQSTSDSQESHGSAQTDAYCGSSYDFTSFDTSAVPALPGSGAYPDPDSAAAGLASPINLHNTQVAGFGSSWLNSGMLQASTTDLNDFNTNVLDPLLPHSQPITNNVNDIHDFEFNNNNISISLDSSALHETSQQPSASNTFASQIDALDLELSTDPLLLQPSRTHTPWIQSSTATPTDYAALFSEPHSPSTTFPDFTDQSQSAAGDSAVTAAFDFAVHQAFAGAVSAELDAASNNASRQQSFSTQQELDPGRDAEAGSTVARESAFPAHNRAFGYGSEFTPDDFANTQHESFGHDQANDGFAHSFDVSGDTHGFDITDVALKTQAQSRGQDQHGCPRCTDLSYCACVSGGAGF